MFGVIFGVSSAFAYGVNAVITRRGVLRASSNYIATISIFTGPLFFFLVAALTGELYRINRFTWQAHGYFALAGVVHFALGRTWGYRSIQLIGSTRSYIVTSFYPVVSIALAMIVFGETIRPLMACGIVLSLAGPLLTLLETSPPSTEKPNRSQVDRRTLNTGIVYGIGAAVFWGSSAILIKLGLEKGGSPVAGSFVAYLAASMAISPSLLDRDKRNEILHADKKSLHLALISGLTTNIGQFLRFLALDYGSVIMVTLLSRTTPLWVLLLSFYFNRENESFSRWVLLGNALLMIGTVLIVVP